MTSLGCNAKNCVNNKNDYCCLNSIKVEGCTAKSCDDTCCQSFMEERDGQAKNSTNAPKFELNISCGARNCMYNENKMCRANHVDISGISATDSDETVCTTFKCK